MGLDPELLKQLGLKRASDLESPDGAAAELPWNEAAAAESERRASPSERSDRSILRQHRENRIAAGTLRVPQVRPRRREDDADEFEDPIGAQGSDGSGEGTSDGDGEGAVDGPSDGSGSARRRTRGSGRSSSDGRRSSRGGGGKGAGARGGRASRGRGDSASGVSASSSGSGSGSGSAVRGNGESDFVPAPAPEWADVGAPPAWATDGELPERVSTILEEWDRREAEAAELIAAGVEVLPADEQHDAAQVIELSDEEAEQLARAICLRLLTAMPRTRFELEKKLQERDVPWAAAQTVLDRYEELGIINDAAFAAAWVESRARSKGFARGRLKQELRRKGVDGEDLDAALEQIDTDQERERAEELALRKLGSRTLPPASGYGTPDAAERDKILRRVIGFLARKGYPGGMAMSAARRAMERHDAGER